MSSTKIARIANYNDWESKLISLPLTLDSIGDENKCKGATDNEETDLKKPIVVSLESPKQLSEKKENRDLFVSCAPQKLVDYDQEERWDYCISNIDHKGIEDLLIKRQYPDKRQLRDLCMKVGRKDQLIKLVCTSICTRISELMRETNPTLSSEIIIWPAYKLNDENEIIFVVNIDNNDDITNKIDFEEKNLTILCRSIKLPNKENRYVVKYELDNKIDIDLENLDEMETDINCNFESLRKLHSNITMITASPVKSKGFSPVENKSEITHQNCIVIFVPAKGLIPLQEDRFPERLGRFITDVREVYCKQLVGGPPVQRHDHLKMGCAIGTLNSGDSGTLGGFLKHLKHGLCALTCAHVVLTDNEIQNPQCFTKSTCVQPNTKNATDAFGIVEKDMYVVKCGSGETSGVDAAIIKIDDDEPRIPIDGHFPDCPADDLKHLSGFTEDTLVYRSGKILKLDKTNISQHWKCDVAKFGAETTLRLGKLRNLRIPFESKHVFGHRLDIVFHKQLQIYPSSADKPFAQSGDSGALVFIVTDNGLELIGLLHAGTPEFAVVTPINDVLLALDCNEKSMFVFMDPDSNNTGHCNKKVNQTKQK